MTIPDGGRRFCRQNFCNDGFRPMPPSILVVDDDPNVRKSLEEYLAKMGYDVNGVDSAEDALEWLKSRPVDVIITDIIMKGMDGLSMTQSIKKAYNTDIIVITGYCNQFAYEDAIRKGADDFIFKPVRFEELVLRLKRVLRERELSQERLKILEKLKSLSITDDLTQLFNSRHFYSQLENEILFYQRHHRPLSLLMIDVDCFKRINDTFGHQAGDQVLRQIADCITGCLRAMDSAYRYGGEEFTVILPGTTAKAALRVADRINASVRNALFHAADQSPLTVSIGVTQFAPGETLHQCIRRADKAMYKAKDLGRNQTVLLTAGV